MTSMYNLAMYNLAIILKLFFITLSLVAALLLPTI